MEVFQLQSTLLVPGSYMRSLLTTHVSLKSLSAPSSILTIFALKKTRFSNLFQALGDVEIDLFQFPKLEFKTTKF